MPIPAFLPAAAVVAGVALGTSAGLASLSGPAVAVLLVALVLSVAAFVRRAHATFIVTLSVVFGAGAFALACRAESDAQHPWLRDHFVSLDAQGPVWLEGTLREDAAIGANGVAITVDVERWMSRGAWRPLRGGGVRLNVGGTMGVDRITEWRGGRRVRVPALLHVPGRYQDPGVADGRLALARRGIVFVGSVKSAALVELVSRGGLASELSAHARDLTRRAIHRHVGVLDARTDAIVVAILIGDRAGLDDDIQRQLQEAGTYHVIAISGGNIAIVAGLLLWILRLLRVGHRAGSWLTMVAVVSYASIVGGGASVVRAALMAVIYLLARQADLRGSPFNAIAVACAVLLVVSPSSIADVGFWLTFGATLGIVAGVQVAGASLPRAPWLRAPAALLLTSLCAELALFPIAARVFSRVTFAGLALNFIAIPMMSVAEVAGMVVVALAPVWPSAADVAGRAAHLGATGLVRSAALVELAPWLSYRLPPPHAAVIAGYYGAWSVWFAIRAGIVPLRAQRRRMSVRMAVGVIVACGAWVLVEPVTLLAPGVSGRLRVTCVDVGHGDSVLVQLPDRRSMLVDCGGSLSGSAFDIGGRVVAPTLWALGTRRLDVLLLSHGDPDHAGGAASIVRDFRPREIWEGIPVPSLPVMQRLQAQAAAAGIPFRGRRAGEVIRFGTVMMRVWHPPPPDWERQRVRNDDSVVVEVRYGDVSFVLSGDIGREVEGHLATEFGPARIRVMKVPHHGSITSSSSAFVSALRPHIAALSAGATTKVSDEVLKRYEDVGAAIYRTDRDGAITMETDGRSVTVTTFTGGRGVFTK